MKTIKYFIAIMTLIVTISACKKDPCKKKQCQNGGVCMDGTCKCANGYSGTNCETYNPCYNITCLNGGTCANGICNCPTGYTGSNCGTEKTPVSVTITKIVLTSFPPSDNGYYWDPSSGTPDIFLSINSGTTANTNDFTSGTASDAADGVSITYTNYFPVTISSPSSNWVVGLWDYDSSDPNDFMGGIYFTPNSFKSGFPSIINLSYSSISMTLYVTWNF